MNADKIKELQAGIARLEQEDREERRRQRQERQRQEHEEHKRRRAELLERHGLAGKPYADAVWSFAWEHGHSYGWSEVEIWLDDLTDLIDEVLKAERAS